ncbi:hypothetical protein ACSLBF_18340 (plasmid) [Pseudoalteromonas sp. T1lg65]|uniref:hypothetical protein n=1 Tax=Pseudoalteromonas sp. T1lg65 TaxID=2077101 RepID=UPI003F7AC761
MLYMAAAILMLCGLIHSILGEKYILIRLFRRDNLPHLFGSDVFTKGTLRFAWHITSFAWFGFAGLILLLPDNVIVLYTVTLVFAISGLLSFYYTRGKHLSWIAFFTVSALSWLSM